jgi:hypothetical protein
MKLAVISVRAVKVGAQTQFQAAVSTLLLLIISLTLIAGIGTQTVLKSRTTLAIRIVKHNTMVHLLKIANTL